MEAGQVPDMEQTDGMSEIIMVMAKTIFSGMCQGVPERMCLSLMELDLSIWEAGQEADTD